MKKKLLTLCALAALLLSPTVSWAKPVSADQARQAAEVFLKGIGCEHAGSIVDRSSDMPFRNFYLFAADEGGFVLVSADDCVMPILGYSATNRFESENLPAHVADWLGGYEEQIAYFVKLDQQLRASGLQAASLAEPSSVETQWRMLRQGQMPPAVQNTVVSPMLTTAWNQSPRYNNLCPADNASSSGHAVAGCTAIATAQVMKYWNHPATGYGSYAYNHSDYGTVSANFGTTTYQWNQMPNSLTSSSTQTQINAVATLVYHVGVAVEMDYGASGSGARTINYGDIVTPSAENALKYYFKYKSTLHSISRADYTPAQFATILTNELAAGRPIIFTGYDTDAGHAFVLDGVNNSGDYHVNWGWGSYCDGYYTMGALNPSTGGTGGNTSGTYNIDNSAIIGIEPNTSFNPNSSTSIIATSSNTNFGSADGSGNYLFGDTVVLVANASSGCRFLQWNDGDKHNPRYFIATGGNYNLTATYEQLHGDTLSYAATDTWLTSFGGTNNADWGIRLPASVLTANHNLKKVQLMIAGAGSYTVTIYAGSLANAPVATQSFTATSAEVGSWKTIQLISPVYVNGNQDLWITFHNSDVTYPAALTYDCGNADGMLWTTAYTSIRSSWNYTFMIRGIFEQNNIASGDTISYCDNDSYSESIGAGGAIYWGIMLPSANLTGRNALNAVQLYVYEPGTYLMSLAQSGTTAPGAPLMTKTVVFTTADTGRWNTITLDHPMALNSSQPLWVTFYCNDASYPAAGSAATSDFNGSWVSTDGSTWSSLYAASGSTLNLTWMIRCITSPNPPALGVSIDGPDYFSTGMLQTFTASCNYPGATYTWTLSGASNISGTGNTRTAQWNNAGTYNVIVAATVSGTTVRDTLQVTTYSCDVTTFPYSCTFDNGMQDCWTTLDSDGDGYGWELFSDSTVTHSGSLMLVSASYVNNVGALTPDNWFISPAITLPQGATASLSWYAKGLDANYATEHYTVYVSTTGAATSNFTTQLYTGNSSASWTQQTSNLSAYAGQTIRIAFRHHNISDMYYLCIDDIAITASAAPTTYTITATANNPAYGTVTGGGTYNYGSTVTLTATPFSGYEFVQWNDGNTDATRTITVTGNATYTAIFQAIPDETYTITATANNPAYGTVTGGGTYNAGTTVTLTATPSTGYEFVQWNDGNTNATRTITVTANASYIANFQVIPAQTYTITATPNNPAYGAVTGSGTYNAGAPVTLTATPFSGYVFTGWSNGLSYNPYTFAAAEDLVLQAIFEPETGIDEADAAGYMVYATGRSIVVRNADQRQVRVYDISGRMVSCIDNADNEQRIEAPHGGIYFVVVSTDYASKVMVY